MRPNDCQLDPPAVGLFGSRSGLVCVYRRNLSESPRRNLLIPTQPTSAAVSYRKGRDDALILGIPRRRQTEIWLTGGAIHTDRPSVQSSRNACQFLSGGVSGSFFPSGVQIVFTREWSIHSSARPNLCLNFTLCHQQREVKLISNSIMLQTQISRTYIPQNFIGAKLTGAHPSIHTCLVDDTDFLPYSGCFIYGNLQAPVIVRGQCKI